MGIRFQVNRFQCVMPKSAFKKGWLHQLDDDDDDHDDDDDDDDDDEPSMFTFRKWYG